jgi:hypothetical protein
MIETKRVLVLLPPRQLNFIFSPHLHALLYVGPISSGITSMGAVAMDVCFDNPKTTLRTRLFKRRQTQRISAANLELCGG